MVCAQVFVALVAVDGIAFLTAAPDVDLDQQHSGNVIRCW
jgi:hypothetical protein